MRQVSIILPTFNRMKYLVPALESVHAQTLRDWELIIADDGSTEEVREYLRSIGTEQVKILWLPHSGNPSRTRNAAIAVAAGRYLAFLDSDDVWAPQKLAKQVEALCAQTAKRWSYTLCDHIDATGRRLERPRRASTDFLDGWIFEPLLTMQFAIAMPTVVAERELVQEAGGFDEQQGFGEFHDLCVRLALKSEVLVVREPLCSVRVHAEHYSADRVGAHRSWMRLFEKHAALAPTAALRSRCERLRAHASLDLARSEGESGHFWNAWATLLRAVPASYRFPHWWTGAFKALAHLAVARPRRGAPWRRE